MSQNLCLRMTSTIDNKLAWFNEYHITCTGRLNLLLNNDLATKWFNPFKMWGSWALYNIQGFIIKSHPDVRSLFSLTSGSGHGEVRLFFALESEAWFSPSCFLFLLRFGFSASWSSVKTKCLDNKDQILQSHNKTWMLWNQQQITEVSDVYLKQKQINCSSMQTTRWFTSEESFWLPLSLLGFCHIFVCFPSPSSLLFFCSLWRQDLGWFVDIINKKISILLEIAYNPF